MSQCSSMLYSVSLHGQMLELYGSSCIHSYRCYRPPPFTCRRGFFKYPPIHPPLLRFSI